MNLLHHIAMDFKQIAGKQKHSQIKIHSGQHFQTEPPETTEKPVKFHRLFSGLEPNFRLSYYHI